MGFGSYLANGFKTLAFKKEAVAAVRDDPASFKYGLILTCVISLLFGAFVFLSTFVLSALGPSSPSLGLPLMIGFAYAFFAFFFILLGAGITHLLARLFGGIATVMQYYSVWLATVFAITILNIPVTLIGFIPIIGILVTFVFTIYAIFVSVFAIRETYTISTFRATMVLLIPVIVILLFVIAALAYFGVLSLDRFVPA